MKICFDFDGVIHSFISPWQGDEIIPYRPTSGSKGALEFLKKLGGLIYIHSVRCHSPEGRKAIETYMNHHRLHFDQIVEHKPTADLYIEAKAVLFDRNWPDIIELICHAIHGKQEKEREKLNEIFAEDLRESNL